MSSNDGSKRQSDSSSENLLRRGVDRSIDRCRVCSISEKEEEEEQGSAKKSGVDTKERDLYTGDDKKGAAEPKKGVE